MFPDPRRANKTRIKLDIFKSGIFNNYSIFLKIEESKPNSLTNERIRKEREKGIVVN